jgi:hypothetical protein
MPKAFARGRAKDTLANKTKRTCCQTAAGAESTHPLKAISTLIVGTSLSPLYSIPKPRNLCFDSFFGFAARRAKKHALQMLKECEQYAKSLDFSKK